MKRMMGLALAVLFTMSIWMPLNASAQIYERRVYQNQDNNWRERRERQRRWRARMNRNSYGYRNYGMYRRTQVGNRGFTWQRQTYYINGRRYTRMVRVYY